MSSKNDVKDVVNVVSVSGGKDSTAMALLAIERETENLRFVFADTGHEHPETYKYIDYLSHKLNDLCGTGIDTVKQNFDDKISRKRKTISVKWLADGVPPSAIKQALDVMHPTGVPFLDLCLWKGRFPSTMARFCSQTLKHEPLMKYQMDLTEKYKAVISWQGVRSEESLRRQNLPMKDVEFGGWDNEPFGMLIYRPIIDWKAEECFSQHKKFGVDWNPLYEKGMGRVGCMPCIHATKADIREIYRRYPEELRRVADWERIVSLASKRGCSTFMNATVASKYLGTGKAQEDIKFDTHGINTYVKWAQTERGGRQDSIIHTIELEDVPRCSSQYGLCE